jgi:hypothetical protein
MQHAYLAKLSPQVSQPAQELHVTPRMCPADEGGNIAKDVAPLHPGRSEGGLPPQGSPEPGVAREREGPKVRGLL